MAQYNVTQQPGQFAGLGDAAMNIGRAFAIGTGRKRDEAMAAKAQQETTDLARIAEAQAGFQRGDFRDMDNMQKANWMSSMGMTPLKTTAIEDNEAYNPYLNPDQTITMTPRGREEMDLAGALNRAKVRTEGAHQGAYAAAAGASNASAGSSRATTSATQQDIDLQKRIQSGEITVGDALAYKFSLDQMRVGGVPVPDQLGTPDKPRSYSSATQNQVEQTEVLIEGFGGERAEKFKALSAKQQSYMAQMFATEVNRATVSGHPADPRAVFDELWRMHDGKFTPDTSPWYKLNNAESTLGSDVRYDNLYENEGHDMRSGVLYESIPSGAGYTDPKGIHRTKP